MFLAGCPVHSTVPKANRQWSIGKVAATEPAIAIPMTTSSNSARSCSGSGSTTTSSHRLTRWRSLSPSDGPRRIAGVGSEGELCSRTAKTIAPSAARLTSSLRDIGYDFSTAMADVIDNSIAAGASEIAVRVIFDGAGFPCGHRRRWIGDGRVPAGGGAAVRVPPGVCVERSGAGSDSASETASLSQGRRLTVVSRPDDGEIRGLTLDLDHVERTDRWEVLIRDESDLPEELTALLGNGSGTAVVWRTSTEC